MGSARFVCAPSRSGFAAILAACVLLVCGSVPSWAQKPAAVPGAGIMLDALVAGDNPWEMTTADFERKFAPLRLQWLSKTKDQARFFGNYGFWNGELKFKEAIVEFQGGRLFRVNLSLFNRGDSRNQLPTKEAFDQWIAAAAKTVSSHTGIEPVDLGRQGSSSVKASGLTWVAGPSIYLLEDSFQKQDKATGQEFRPEFIRLRIYAAPKAFGLGTKTPAAVTIPQQVSKGSLAANLVKEPGGDIYIRNVPMVDQGPKGYCAVATAERVFRYYGMTVDQHEMAQVANTGSGGGTNPEAMMQALFALQGRLHVHVRAITKWDYAEFGKMLDDYNHEAKRNKKPLVGMGGQRVIDIGAIYAAMDPASLKDAKTVRSKAGYVKFQRALSEHIDKGVPILWSVHLGIFPEPGIPQARGGHMRLIIGYNVKTGEIIYSDSWGARHAMKRMPMDNAWAMTTGMYYVEPSQ